MGYKIERISDTMFLIKPKNWWNDPMSSKDVLAALAEISGDTEPSSYRTSRSNEVVSVRDICRIGSLYLVIVEKG